MSDPAYYYVTVGSTGIIYTSKNASDWVQNHPVTIAPLKGIAFTGNHFIVSGSWGTILSSETVVSSTKNVNYLKTYTKLYVQYLEPRSLNIILPDDYHSVGCEIAVYEINGEKAYSEQVQSVTKSVKLKSPYLPAGVYLVGVRNSYSKLYSKFSVIK